jgi:hypothetical protein
MKWIGFASRWLAKFRLSPPLLALPLFAAGLSGCAVMSRIAPVYGEIGNLEEPACAESFTQQLGSALEQQGETPEDAAGAAHRALRSLPRQSMPNRYQAFSGSGTIYGFYLEPRNSGSCVLRLFERRTDDRVTTNTISFYATRNLATCHCGWVWATEEDSYN